MTGPVPVEVVVAQARATDEYVVVCVTGSCSRTPVIGRYASLRAARVAQSNHRRWHLDQLDRGSACPTCGQHVPAVLRRPAGLPDVQDAPVDPDAHARRLGLDPLPFDDEETP